MTTDPLTTDQLPLRDRAGPQQLRLHRDALFQAQARQRRIQCVHIHRPSPMPCLASISAVAAGIVRRSGFTAIAPRRFHLGQLPLHRGQLLGQLGLAPALLHGGRDPLHLAGQRALALFQPAQRPLQQCGRSLQPLRNAFLVRFPCPSFLD